MYSTGIMSARVARVWPILMKVGPSRKSLSRRSAPSLCLNSTFGTFLRRGSRGQLLNKTRREKVARTLKMWISRKYPFSPIFTSAAARLSSRSEELGTGLSALRAGRSGFSSVNSPAGPGGGTTVFLLTGGFTGGGTLEIAPVQFCHKLRLHGSTFDTVTPHLP